MVAYSFQRQFIAPIVSGRKRQTIRAPRKRHAREGEALQLYTAMRTKQCRPIGTAVCLEARAIELDFVKRSVLIEGVPGGPIDGVLELDSIAQDDGFADFSEMRAFWAGVATFSGVLIRWHQFAPAAEVLAA